MMEALNSEVAFRFSAMSWFHSSRKKLKQKMRKDKHWGRQEPAAVETCKALRVGNLAISENL
jgi:uncharacterized protein involved in copper resistance